MAGKIMDPKVVDFVISNVSNQTDGDILCIRRKRRSVQERRSIWINFAVVHIGPPHEKTVRGLDLMVPTYRELVEVNCLRWDGLKAFASDIGMWNESQHSLCLWGIPVRADYVQDSIARDLGSRCE